MFGEQFSVHHPGQRSHSHGVGNSKGDDAGQRKPGQLVSNGGVSVLEIGVNRDPVSRLTLNLNKEERTEQTKRDEDEKLRENQKSSSAKLIDH